MSAHDGGPLDIRRLDPHDPDAVRAWHATFEAAHRLGLVHPTPWAYEEVLAELAADKPGEHVEAWGGYVDGVPVVAGILELPLMDNLTTARLDIGTHPDARRRGHGTAVLEHLVARAAAEGRTTLQVEASWNHDEPVDGAGTPGAEFLRARGFTFGLGDVVRVLPLPVSDDVLDRLAAQAALRHVGYRLRHFAGAVPDDVIDAYGDLIGSLVTEAPQGELTVETEVFDAARIRAGEAVMSAAGRRRYTTLAYAPDGTLAAFTDLAVPDFDPGAVYQWGTLVRPEHRGHRLGLAVKVDNLRRLQQAEPDRRWVTTWNAEVNEHMIHVNQELGFRPRGRLGEFQRVL